MDVPFIPETAHVIHEAPSTWRRRLVCAAKPSAEKNARGTAARRRTSHLRLCLLPLRADEGEECAAARPLGSPVAVA